MSIIKFSGFQKSFIAFMSHYIHLYAHVSGLILAVSNKSAIRITSNYYFNIALQQAPKSLNAAMSFNTNLNINEATNDISANQICLFKQIENFYIVEK